MFWGNHYVDLFSILVRIVFDDTDLMHIVGLEDFASESEGKVGAKWWVVTTPDSFSGEKSMLAQPCARPFERS